MLGEGFGFFRAPPLGYRVWITVAEPQQRSWSSREYPLAQRFALVGWAKMIILNSFSSFQTYAALWATSMARGVQCCSAY